MLCFLLLLFACLFFSFLKILRVRFWAESSALFSMVQCFPLCLWTSRIVPQQRCKRERYSWSESRETARGRTEEKNVLRNPHLRAKQAPICGPDSEPLGRFCLLGWSQKHQAKCPPLRTWGRWRGLRGIFLFYFIFGWGDLCSLNSRSMRMSEKWIPSGYMTTRRRESCHCVQTGESDLNKTQS